MSERALASIALKWLALVTLAAVSSCGRAAPRPNVVVLVMDTTRADRCSFLGYGRPTTPRLAEFAKDAVAYRDAWSPAGWTGPAHASLFTGMRPDRHGFHDGGRNYLGREYPTLAEKLSAAGYATACFTNNDWIAPTFGLTRGFDKVAPLYVDRKAPYPWAHETHELAAEWAESQARAGRPFFVFINDMEPHLPYTPCAAEEKAFVRGDPTPAELAEARAYEYPRTIAYALGAEERTPRQLALMSDLYDAEIATLDQEIGVLIDRLSASGLLDSTVFVIVGDHGEYLGEHHMAEHGHGLHRAACRVPLLVRWRGAFDGGRSVDSVVRLEDISPTIFEACRVAVPDGLDGASLATAAPGRIALAMQGPNVAKRASFESVARGVDVTPLLAGIESVYDGRMHCLSHSDGRLELYDDSMDPEERDNLAARSPADVARLIALARRPR